MTIYDIATSLIAAFLIVRELLAAGLNNKVVIKGKNSGRFIADIVLLILICALVVIKFKQFSYPYLAPCGMVVFVLVGFIPKSGLAYDGFVCGGKSILFSEIEFYAVEYETDKAWRLRLHTFVREYVIVFAKEDKKAVTEKLDEKKVKFAKFEPGRQRTDEN